MKNNIEIPKWVMAGLVTGLGLSLMTTCFLLGRESARSNPSPPLTPVAPTPSHSSTDFAATTPPYVVETITPGIESTLPVNTPQPAISPSPPLQQIHGHKPHFDAQQAQEVRTYLAATEQVTANTQDLGNPTDFANDLLSQALTGDTSSIDTLIEQTRSSQQALEQIKPPPACRQHHHLLLSQIKTSLQILNQLKIALETSDSLGLAGLASKGNAIQKQVNQLEQMTQELKQRSQ